ncbi:hypothetical protein GCE86_17860 [Micromonospora terminaliae]|uniref:Uncharacterized protein n=1 Tax=Micromonospora terminaliae TaxID=1914461 RepID=A0AAJ3DJW3_9ACTN|nr:hypothetical protein [Micromonospora terminaliae]NES29297.1 hypothetical protein [Micromonospora terminaliae]QGL48719.1 hypothetical protein GCE86_17860 [Micromonospora terminaliae]
MRTKLSVWLALSLCLAVSMAAVVFLALQSLDKADKWASIGSFAAALVTMCGSVVMFTVRRNAAVSDASSAPAAGGRSQRVSRMLNIVFRNRVVINGNHNKTQIDLRSRSDG